MGKLILALSIAMWVVCGAEIVICLAPPQNPLKFILIGWVVTAGLWTLSSLLWSKSSERFERMLKEMRKK